jgi:hypothetical protein
VLSTQTLCSFRPGHFSFIELSLSSRPAPLVS